MSAVSLYLRRLLGEFLTSLCRGSSFLGESLDCLVTGSARGFSNEAVRPLMSKLCLALGHLRAFFHIRWQIRVYSADCNS